VRPNPAAKTVTRLAAQGHLVGEHWVPAASGDTYLHCNPSTGSAQAEVGLGSVEDINEAVEAARAALPGWTASAPDTRAAILFRLADLLEEHAQEAGELAALDNGTPIGVMNSGTYAASWVRYYAGWCTKIEEEEIPTRRGRGSIRREPYGVVAAIPPWNGSMMGMGQKCGPALAAGNTVVAKPPELAPFGMLRFAELAREAGLPPGVLNVVVGGATAGAALAGHRGVDKISFTGGTATGRRLMELAARHLTPLALELGGKSPNIIFPDADLNAAAKMAAFAGSALLSGQGCALPTRLYVHDDVYDEVVALVVQLVSTMSVGDPLDPQTLVGPVVNEAALHRILGVIAQAEKDGATLLTGGSRLGGELAGGWFVAPTIFGNVDHRSDLARNEVFGPVLAILRFESDEEALAKANDSEFGLSAYLHTQDPDRIERFTRRLDAGTVVVNGMGGTTPAAPFGGTKQSGFGREGGRAGLEEMLRQKAVFVSS
jgi:aldehyde dehydrogenase (NAD+)